jgi:hypothetical protein
MIRRLGDDASHFAPRAKCRAQLTGTLYVPSTILNSLVNFLTSVKAHLRYWNWLSGLLQHWQSPTHKTRVALHAPWRAVEFGKRGTLFRHCALFEPPVILLAHLNTNYALMCLIRNRHSPHRLIESARASVIPRQRWHPQKAACGASRCLKAVDLRDPQVERAAVTANMAARLGRAFGNSERFCMKLRAAHDAWEAPA